MPSISAAAALADHGDGRCVARSGRVLALPAALGMPCLLMRSQNLVVDMPASADTWRSEEVNLTYITPNLCHDAHD